MKGLRVFDDDVCPALERNGLSERAFNLPRDAEMVEYGHLLGVELHNVLAFRSDESHIVLYLLHRLLVVDVDAFKAGAEQVANHAHSPRLLLENEGRRLAALHLGYRVFPAFHERAHLMVEFGYTFVLGRSPDYHAETFRLYVPYKLAKAYLLLGGLDFARHGNLFGKWNQHHEPSGEGYFGGESRAFRRNRFFCNLHQKVLSLRKHLRYGTLLRNLLLGLEICGRGDFLWVGERFLHESGIGHEVRAEIEIMKKSVLVVAHVDERGVEAGHQLAHLCQIKVAHRVRDVAALLLERHKPGVFGQRDRNLLLLHVYN